MSVNSRTLAVEPDFREANSTNYSRLWPAAFLAAQRAFIAADLAFLSAVETFRFGCPPTTFGFAPILAMRLATPARILARPSALSRRFRPRRLPGATGGTTGIVPTEEAPSPRISLSWSCRARILSWISAALRNADGDKDVNVFIRAMSPAISFCQ